MALLHIKEGNYVINNLGVSIEAKMPKILTIKERMKNRLVEILQIKKLQIGINATSGEDLTAFGRGEGVRVFVVISFIKLSK